MALFLTSCASAPKKQDIQKVMTVPDKWTNSFTSKTDPDSLWWKEFNDKNLEKILDEALLNNQGLHISAINVLAAAAQAKIAGAPVLPDISASFDSRRNKQNFIGFPIPGSEGQVLSTTNTSYGVSLNLNWELDLWRKLSSTEAAALATVQAAEADYKGARLSLAAQVCKAWFAAIEAKRQMQLSEATLENLRLSNEQVRTRYERGLRSSLDYRMSLSNLSMTESTLTLRKIQYENSVRQLELLLGRYPSASLEISEILPELTIGVPAGLPSEVITRRPDLIAAERTLASAKSGITSARGDLFPKLSLTASTGTSTKELKELINGDFSIWSLGGNILQPIFQRGRLRAALDAAKLSADIALEQYVQSVLTAFSEVESSLASEKYLGEREVSIRAATEQSIAARTLAEEQYSSGLSDFITMLEAQRSAYDNESQLLTILRERLDARIDLYLAIGGSFDYEPEKKENNTNGEFNNE